MKLSSIAMTFLIAAFMVHTPKILAKDKGGEVGNPVTNSTEKIGNECKYKRTDARTGKILETVVLGCNFKQTTDDFKSTKIVVQKDSTPLQKNECKYRHIDARTGKILKIAVLNCDFKQTIDHLKNTKIAIQQDPTPLEQETKKDFSKTCEEVTETYVICNEARYELVKSSSTTLKRDVKNIEKYIDLNSEKLNSGTGTVSK